MSVVFWALNFFQMENFTMNAEGLFLLKRNERETIIMAIGQFALHVLLLLLMLGLGWYFLWKLCMKKWELFYITGLDNSVSAAPDTAFELPV